MKQHKPKIITSNVRFPEDEWIQLKIAANSAGMSTNAYIQYLFRATTIQDMTGTKVAQSKPEGLSALIKFAQRQHRGKPMGASDDDKAIYGIED